eukprot:PhM_4_TR2741/c1_g1_i1/m.106967
MVKKNSNNNKNGHAAAASAAELGVVVGAEEHPLSAALPSPTHAAVRGSLRFMSDDLDITSLQRAVSMSPRKHNAATAAAATPQKNVKGNKNNHRHHHLHHGAAGSESGGDGSHYRATLISSSNRNEAFMNWSVKKVQILQAYTTKENFPVQSKLLEDDEEARGNSNSAPASTPNTATEEAKQKLERLEEGNRGGPHSSTHTQFMSQKELINHVEFMATDLTTAWENGEKVRSLRITIQACKLIGHTKVPVCYPSVFVLVSKVLDLFGRFVYERVYKCASRDRPLPPNFKPSDVPDEAKDMCLNWFYKIASIRELLPRIYVEMCLLPCNAFLEDRDTVYAEVSRRLARQLRGVGDLIVANHARLYLALKIQELGLVTLRPVVEGMLSDIFNSSHHMDMPRHATFLADKNLTQTQYISLFLPSMSWLMEASSCGDDAHIDVMTRIFDLYQTKLRHGPILHLILSSFPSHMIFTRYSTFFDEVVACDQSSPCAADLWSQLGLILAEVNPRERKMHYLRNAWPYVIALPSPQLIQKAAASWCVYVAMCLRPKDVNALILDIRDRMQISNNGGNGEENAAGGTSLSILLNTCVAHIPDVVSLLQLEAFANSLCELSRVDKCETSMFLLERLKDSGRTVSDPLVVNAVLECAKIVHDDMLTWHSTASDVEAVSSALCAAVSKVAIADFDAQLSFLCDCRRYFTKIDAVKVLIVQRAVAMVRAMPVSKGNIAASRTAVAAKACLAYCHVTVPAVMDVWARLRLCYACSCVALRHNLLQKAEVFLKLIMTTLNEATLDATTPPNDDVVFAFVSSLIGLCIAVPGHPEFGAYYLLQSIAVWNGKYGWGVNTHAACETRCRIEMLLLRATGVIRRNAAPYAFAGVVSNEILYAPRDAATMESEADDIMNKATEAALRDVQAFAQAGVAKKTSMLGVELASVLALELTTPSSSPAVSDVMSRAMQESWRLARSCLVQGSQGFLQSTSTWAAANIKDKYAKHLV